MILRDKYFGGATDSGAIRVDYNSILQQLGMSTPSTIMLEVDYIWRSNAKQFVSGIYFFKYIVSSTHFKMFFFSKKGVKLETVEFVGGQIPQPMMSILEAKKLKDM